MKVLQIERTISKQKTFFKITAQFGQDQKILPACLFACSTTVISIIGFAERSDQSAGC